MLSAVPHAAARWLTALVLLTALATAARPQSPQVPPPTPPTIDQFSERVRALEEANKRLSERGKTADRPDAPPRAAPEPVVDSPVPDYTEGQFSPYSTPRFPSPAIGAPGRYPLTASFGPGFLFQTDDDRFSLKIHYESQIEGRFWQEGDQVPANAGFFLPRQRFFFDGNITRQVEYELSINRGLGGINVLNAYLNFHFDDRFELRIGRFFTPFTYDQYAVSNYWLLTPERSVFTTNLSPNR